MAINPTVMIFLFAGIVMGGLGIYFFTRSQQQHLQKNLQSLCYEALQNNNRLFLDLAQTSLGQFQEIAKNDLAKRQQAIDYLVQPIKQSLEKVDQKIAEIEKNRLMNYAGLSEQIKSLLNSEMRLRQETANLVKALRVPQVRGRWGEIQLQRVLELAGMQEYCDFQQQQSVTVENQRFRPDVIVRLPGNKNIVIDAKAPLSSFLDAFEQTDELQQQEKMQQHARLIREHIKALSSKAYWAQFQPAPEFVILFLPGEMFFSTALAQDATLIEHGVTQQVLLATPTTLIALLKAVAYGWRQEKLAENSQQIAILGKDLAKRLQDMHQHFGEVGQKLQKTVESYNKTIGSYESRVLVAARRFQEFNHHEESKLISPSPVEIQVRGMRQEMVSSSTCATEETI